MIEWLKEIIGEESYTDELDGKIAAAMGKHMVSRSDFNAKNDELKAATATIASLQDAAKAYEGVDVAGLQQQIADAKTQYEEQLAGVRLSSAIDLALAGAKARNAKAVRAMIDLSEVSLDDNGELQGLSDQLAGLQNSDPWLFNTAETVSTGTPHGNPLEPAMDGVEAAFRANNPGLKF